MEKNKIIRVAVLGAESTGKTALCEALALHFGEPWVPEYAREYFNNSDIYNYTLDDLTKIAEKQEALEKKIERAAKRILFCDTSFITLKIWAQLEFNTCPVLIEDLVKESFYDHYLITSNEVSWVKDQQRKNKFSRDQIFEMNVEEVNKLKGRYTVIRGVGAERTEKTTKIIEGLL